MKSTGFLTWIGIVLVSLLLGQVVGMFSSQAFDQLIPIPDSANFSVEYEKRLILISHLQFLVFIWMTLASIASLGFGSQVRFHLLFFHGLAAICFSLYLVVHFHQEIKTLDGKYHRNYFPDIWQVAGPECFLLLFFIILGVLLFLSALIVDKDEQLRQRNYRRQNRNFASDGHRPPLH